MGKTFLKFKHGFVNSRILHDLQNELFDNFLPAIPFMVSWLRDENFMLLVVKTLNRERSSSSLPRNFAVLPRSTLTSLILLLRENSLKLVVWTNTKTNEYLLFSPSFSRGVKSASNTVWGIHIYRKLSLGSPTLILRPLFKYFLAYRAPRLTFVSPV